MIDSTSHSRKRLVEPFVGILALVLGSVFFAYPFATILSASFGEAARRGDFVRDFPALSSRYARFAADYLERDRGSKVHSDDVAATEWPIFGSVFYLTALEELAKEDASLLADARVTSGAKSAAQLVTSKSAANWVRVKWGASYLERENVFYRMLLVLGLGSYESTTGDTTYSRLLREQSSSLLRELLEAPHHLADDYPGECYPNDVLWAVSALKRSARLGYVSEEDVSRLSAGLLATLEGPASRDGLPTFRAEKETAKPLQPARGSGTSGLLSFAFELDRTIASRWFERYVRDFYEPGFVRGFREMPRGTPDWEDVDSGPVVRGVGSVATAFGVGAARSAGRLDIARPLYLESLAGSWPTPFGALVPGLLGWLAADGFCFGELALTFSWSRPLPSSISTPDDASPPAIVLSLLALYGALFCLSAFPLVRWLRAVQRRTTTPDSNPQPRRPFAK